MILQISWQAEHLWSSGYDVSLTRWRSPARTWPGVFVTSKHEHVAPGILEVWRDSKPIFSNTFMQNSNWDMELCTKSCEATENECVLQLQNNEKITSKISVEGKMWIEVKRRGEDTIKIYWTEIKRGRKRERERERERERDRENILLVIELMIKK